MNYVPLFVTVLKKKKNYQKIKMVNVHNDKKSFKKKKVYYQ